MSENTGTKVDTKFKSGELWTGNAKGKPKGARHMSTLIREAIMKVADDKGSSDDILIVQALVKKAKEGELKAIDMIMDRVDGKAEQIINLDADVKVDDGLSQEQRDALLALLK